MNASSIWSHHLTIAGKMGRRDYANRLIQDQRALESPASVFLEAATEEDLKEFLSRYTQIVSETIAWEAQNWRAIHREQKQAKRRDPFLREISRMAGPGLGHKPVTTRAGVSVLPETLYWFEEAMKKNPNALIVVAMSRALQRTK